MHGCLERTVRELEVAVKQQSAELEKGKALRQKVTQEKGQLEIQVATLGAELQEASRRSVLLLKEKEEQREQYEQALQKLRAAHEADLSHYQQEHSLSAAKASEVMEDLERGASQLRQQLQEAEHRRQKQLRDQEMKFQREKEELQAHCEGKVQSALSKAEKEKAEAKKTAASLEESLR
ncbi:hypothetical protein CRUP_002838 [Coryphaenoides rupestris]|nr:hypothetical protein CRUP_002838 [Coryphaenoides rupestris]